MKRILLQSLLFLIPLCLFPLYRIDMFTLQNGLTIILSPKVDVNSVCILTYHKNGVKDDPPEMRGASYLYQKLMFLETDHLAPYERVLFVKKNGGRSSGRVFYDNSVFYQVVPETDLNYALWIESERLKSLHLTSRNINMQKKAIYGRIYNLTAKSIEFRAFNFEQKNLFAGTLYETPLYGDLERINSFPIERIKDIYGIFTNPKNIIMVISGNFDENSIKPKIEKYFGDLYRTGPLAGSIRIPERKSSYIYTNWMREVIPKHFILFGIHAPSKMSLDYIYFEFFRYYLADPRISKLKRLFSGTLKMDVEVNSRFSDNIGLNSFILKLSSHERSEIEKARFYTNKIFEVLVTDRIVASEVKAVKSLMELDFLKKITAPEERAKILAENYYISGNLDYGNSYLKRIRNINAYDLLRVGKKYFAKSNLVVLNVISK